MDPHRPWILQAPLLALGVGELPNCPTADSSKGTRGQEKMNILDLARPPRMWVKLLGSPVCFFRVYRTFICLETRHTCIRRRCVTGPWPCPCGAVGAGEDAWKTAFLVSSSLLDSGKPFKHQNWALVICRSFITLQSI